MVGAKESFDTIQIIHSQWQKKIGLLLAIILLAFIYYGINEKISIPNPFNIITPLLLLLIIIIAWYLTTNRLLLKKSNKLGVYVSINCDKDFEQKAKSIFETVIEEINKDTELKMLYADFVPFNLFSNHKEIETWLDKQNGEYNAIIFLKIKNGKINSEEAIKIDGASYTGFFKNNNLSINGENLNIMQDLNLLLQSTDWNYLEKNCLGDKEKLRNNLKDLILYYGGLFYLNESHFDYSRIILKRLYNPKQSIVPAKKDPNDESTINLEVNHKHLIAGRLNYLLTNIYLKCVINKYNEDKTHDAITLLHEVENFPIPPDVKSTVYINLAYMYYIVNNIEHSKQYTSLIHSVNPKSFAYLINLGFYAIIENNIIAFSQHYTIIDENMALDSQPVEVIAFLNDRSEIYSSSILLIEAAVAILTKLFVDENDGNIKLKQINDKIPSSNHYKSLKRLVEKTLKRKLSKKTQRQLHKAKKAA